MRKSTLKTLEKLEKASMKRQAREAAESCTVTLMDLQGEPFEMLRGWAQRYGMSLAEFMSHVLLGWLSEADEAAKTLSK